MKLLSNLAVFLIACTFSSVVLAGRNTYEENMRAQGFITIAEYGKQLSDKANGGDKEAQYNIAWMYYRGDPPFQINYKKAYDYWSKAANNNYALAANMLGIMYEDGKGVVKNDTKAVVCYTHSASLKNFDGSMNLSRKYWSGEGIVQDHTVAYALNVVAAPQDSARAYSTQINRSKLEKWLTPIEIEEAKKLAKELKVSTNYYITIEKYLNLHGKTGFIKPIFTFKLD
jgi:Sel1 repeat